MKDIALSLVTSLVVIVWAIKSQEPQPAPVEDITADDVAALIGQAIETGEPVLIPAGEYTFDSRLLFRVNEAQQITIRGEGADRTTLRLADGAVTGRWEGLLHIIDDTGESSISLADLGVSTNATGNPLPDGAGPYEFEQAAAVALFGFRDVSITDCATRDNVADGFWIAGKAAGNIRIERIVGTDRTRTRSDVTVTVNAYDRCEVRDCQLTAIDFEPNALSPGENNSTQLVNVTADRFDLGATGDVLLAGCRSVDRLWLSNGRVVAVDCKFEFDRMTRLVRGRFQFHRCTFAPTRDFSGPTRWHNGLLYHSAQPPASVLFDHCSFVGGSRSDPDHAYWPYLAAPGAVSFVGCQSDFPLFPTDRSGNYRIE